jgi:hypothetical protein
VTGPSQSEVAGLPRQRVPKWENDPWAGDDESHYHAVEAACGVVVARVTSWAAPLQLSGLVGGLPFYFRSRHGRWTIEGGGRVYGFGDWDVEDVSEAMALVLECPHFKQQLYNWPLEKRTA